MQVDGSQGSRTPVDGSRVGGSQVGGSQVVGGATAGALLAALVSRFERAEAALPAGDHNRHFCGMYLRNTRSLAAALARGGFRDPAWVAEWTVAFAGLYLDALEDWQAGRPVARPWQLALGAHPDVPPVRHLLVGLNAHLSFDLPQALLAVVTDADLDDPARRAVREDDFRRIDALVVRRVPEEYRYLRSVGGPARDEVLARLLYPANLRASRRWLVDARAAVWRNALLLSEARRAGPAAYAARLADLDVLCAAKVTELLRPGPVLLRLVVTGFGVDLPPLPPPAGRPRPPVPEPRAAVMPGVTTW